MTLLSLLFVGAGAFVALVVGLQVLVWLRARALEGKPLPMLPGPLDAKLRSLEHGLVYFMSPACGACRRYTPELSARSRQRRDVFVIDVTRHLEVARALGVLATPSAIEVSEGRVVGVHVGGVPREVLARFG